MPDAISMRLRDLKFWQDVLSGDWSDGVTYLESIMQNPNSAHDFFVNGTGLQMIYGIETKNSAALIDVIERYGHGDRAITSYLNSLFGWDYADIAAIAGDDDAVARMNELDVLERFIKSFRSSSTFNDYFLLYTKLMPPYPSDLVAYISFENGSLVPEVGNFSLTNTGTTSVAGPLGEANGARKGAAGATGLMASAKIIPLNSAMTFHFRMLVNSGEHGWGAVLTERGANTNQIGFYIRASSVASFNVYNSSSATYILLGTKKIDDGIWHDVVISWTGTTEANGVKIYIDGELDVQGASTTQKTAVSASNTAIFNTSPFDSPYSSPITLSQIAIYNTVKIPSDFMQKIIARP